MATAPEFVTLTIPANCADDFRCAVVDVMAFDAGWFIDEHANMVEKLASPLEWGDRAATARVDRDGALAFLRQNSGLLSQLDDGDVEMTVSDTAGSLRFVLDRVGKTLTSRIAEQFEYGPAKLADVPMLMDRLEWAVEQGQSIGGRA